MSGQPIITVVVPLVICFFMESKMNRLYRTGRVHVLISNCLTAMVGFNYYVQIWQKPQVSLDTKLQTKQEIANEQDHAELVKTLGMLIYGSTLIACVISFFNYKLMLKKSWEN